MLTLVSFVALLTIIVFIHELGHFLVARWCGVKVVAFSIGFGKEIWAREDRHGTRWRLAWIPLGGYVKFVDDANESSMPARLEPGVPAPEGAFQTRPLLQRTAIVSAGPIANFLLSISLFTLLFMSVGAEIQPARVDVVTPKSAAEAAGFKVGDLVRAVDERAIDSRMTLLRIIHEGGDRSHSFRIDRDGREVILKATPVLTEITDPMGGRLKIGRLGIEDRLIPATIGRVMPGSPAEAAGLKAGDTLKSIDGKELGGFTDLVRLVSASPGRELVLGVVRDGASYTIRATPKSIERKEGAATVTVGQIGIVPVELEVSRQRLGLGEALMRGVRDTWEVVPSTFKFIKDVVVGRQSLEQLRGPIGIAEITGRMARRGISDWLFTVALISAAIGLFNLFPIPMLDGGHLMFYALEAIRRKPLSEFAQEMSFRVGFAMVIMLMFFVIWNDSGILRQWLSLGG